MKTVIRLVMASILVLTPTISHADPSAAAAAAIDAAAAATDAANAAYDAANTAMDSSDAATAAAQNASDHSSAAQASLATFTSQFMQGTFVDSAPVTNMIQAAISMWQQLLITYQNQKSALQTNSYVLWTDPVSKTLIKAIGFTSAIAQLNTKVSEYSNKAKDALTQSLVAGITDQEKLNWSSASTYYTSAAKSYANRISNLQGVITRLDTSLSSTGTQIATLTSALTGLQELVKKGVSSKNSGTPPTNAGNGSSATNQSGNSSSDGSTVPDLSAEEVINDSIAVTLVSSKKSRIDIESSYPSTRLLVTASKKGVKVKLTYRITTKADGSFTFNTAVNLRGYTVILFVGKTELDRTIVG